MTTLTKQQQEIDAIFSFMENKKDDETDSSTPVVEANETIQSIETDEVIEEIQSIETDVLFETEEKIWERVNNIFDFIRMTHPFIPEENGEKIGFEIRFFINKKEKSVPMKKSFLAVDFSEKRKLELFEMMKENNGKPICMYYSLASFDIFKKVKNSKTGQMYIPYKIQNSTFVKSQVLAMDFDELTYEQYIVQKQRINDLGIEMVELQSGKGFQCLILLKEAHTNKTALKRFTELLIDKGFTVDEKIKDLARIMRLFASRNCKAYCLQNEKRYDVLNPSPIEVTYLNETDKRYDLEYVFDCLESLPSTKKTKKASKQEETIKVVKKSTLSVKKVAKTDKEIFLKESTPTNKALTVYGSVDEYFSYIKPSLLPNTIRRILNGVGSGLRNEALMFMMPFFKNSMGLELEAIETTALEWNHLCSPPESEDLIIKSVRSAFYKAEGKIGAYTENLENIYGVKEVFAVTFDKTIEVNNVVFHYFDKIQNAAVRLYFAVVLLTHNNKEKKITNFTAEEINTFANVSSRTFERTIKILTQKTRLLGRKKAKKADGEVYTYYLNKAVEKEKLGKTYFTPNDLKLLFKEHKLGEINDTHMALYLFLHSMSYVKGKEIFATQEHFAEKLGKSQNRVSELMKELEKQEKIKIIRIRKGAKMKNNYLLQ